MTVYKSKLGYAIGLPLIGIVFSLSAVSIAHHTWVPLVSIVLVGAILFYGFKSTYYTIDGRTLNIHAGFMINTDIDISKIKSVTKTNSAWSAPAWSLNRIEIAYNTYDSIIISPPDIDQFVADLQAINPAITFEAKNKK